MISYTKLLSEEANAVDRRDGAKWVQSKPLFDLQLMRLCLSTLQALEFVGITMSGQEWAKEQQVISAKLLADGASFEDAMSVSSS